MEQSIVTPIKIGNTFINIIDLYSLISRDTLTPIAHAHEHFEMHIVLKGSAKIQINNETFNLEKDNLVIIPPSFVHTAITKSYDYASSVLAFEFKPADSATQNKYEYKYFSDIFSLDKLFIVPITEYERNIVNLLLKNSNTFTIYSINKMNLEISNLFLEIANKLYLINQTKKDDNIIISSNELAVRKYKIELFIQKAFNNGEEPSLRSLAESLYISTRQAERSIKQMFGITYKQLCTKYRMIIANNLIIEGKKSIEEIAHKAGFDSYNGFLVAYKKYYGHPPSKIKPKSISNNN